MSYQRAHEWYGENLPIRHNFIRVLVVVVFGEPNDFLLNIQVKRYKFPNDLPIENNPLDVSFETLYWPKNLPVESYLLDSVERYRFPIERYLLYSPIIRHLSEQPRCT